jgi:DNA-binding beta-propeller fold protein YncE
MANFFSRVKGTVRPTRGAQPVTAGRDDDALSTRWPIGDLTVDPDSGVVVATHYGARAVSLLDADASTVTGVLAVPGAPFAVAASGDRAYVSTTSDNHDAVTVIDTAVGAVIAEYPLAFDIVALAVSPDGKKVFAGRAGYDHADVAVIDTTAERAGTIDVATGPGINLDALRVDATGKRLYVGASDANGSRLVVVDIETARVAATVRIGAPIRDLALDAEATAYVLTSHRTRGGAVEIVDLTTLRVIGSLAVGRAPVQLELSPDATRAYVVDFDHVAVLCTMTNEVLETITVGARPSCIALSTDGRRLYVADYAGAVSAFPVASAQRLPNVPLLATDRLPMPVREFEPVAV